jgi:hypothetical protein
VPKDKNGKRSTYVARKIDDWMDRVIKDPNLAPNHSFRHYLKSELLARDVPERISDAITGHKTPGIGRKYEHVEMAKKFEAVSKLPVVPSRPHSSAREPWPVRPRVHNLPSGFHASHDPEEGEVGLHTSRFWTPDNRSLSSFHNGSLCLSAADKALSRNVMENRGAEPALEICATL